jgi:hypothetical protein
VVEEAVEAVEAGDVEPHEIDKCACGKIATCHAPETEEPLCDDCQSLHEQTQDLADVELDQDDDEEEEDLPYDEDDPVREKITKIAAEHWRLVSLRPEWAPCDDLWIVVYDPDTDLVHFDGYLTATPDNHTSAVMWSGAQVKKWRNLMVTTSSWEKPGEKAANSGDALLADLGLKRPEPPTSGVRCPKRRRK